MAASARNGVLNIYVVDSLTLQVQVFNGNSGKWVRTIGKKWDFSKPAPQYGHLQLPIDVAVDDDGNVYVSDIGAAAGDAQRISKFDPSGRYLFEFHNAGSDATKFLSPHGVTIGDQGEIYVANTGMSDVYRFREKPPALETFVDDHTRAYWISSKGAWFNLNYNGVEQTCRAGVTATITASAHTFTVTDGPFTVGAASKDLKVDLTTQQVNLIKLAWSNGKKILVSVRFDARCQDGKVLQKSFRFTK